MISAHAPGMQLLIYMLLLAEQEGKAWGISTALCLAAAKR
jgi:hypothetical protein